MASTTENSMTHSFAGVIRRWSALVLLLGTLLITLSSIGFWIQWTVMSERGFVELSGNVLSSTESRETIARAVVDQLFVDNPILRSLVRDPIEGLITGILGSSLLAAGIDFVAEKIWEAVFVEQGQIVLDISSLRAFLYGVISAIAPDIAAGLSPENMPDELVLLDADALPDMGRISSLVAFTTWFAFFGGLVIVGIVIARAWEQPVVRYALIAWAGILIVVEALIIGVLTFPMRSVIIVGIENSTGREIIASTLDVLVQRLHMILVGLAIVGALMIAVGVWKRQELLHGTPADRFTSPEQLPSAAPSGAAGW